MGEFEAVIGLEVHVQLATKTKIFCSCLSKPSQGASVGEIGANLYTCPVCAGHPGTLPVINRQAVTYAIRAGLATGCEIRNQSTFARKNYFYPDLPKGYQITQLDRPICENGRLGSVRIKRIHLEEDAGKNVHMAGYSLVNLNRAGVPLIEIVTEPDLRSAGEAGDYLRELYGVVTFLGICDGNLQEGNFRCDANVSVRPAGQKELGTRCEIKNVNSFRFVEKAVDFEIRRQIEVIKAGGGVVQETRGYDSFRGVTVSQRGKEEAQDYRYFPDPDLLPIIIPAAWIESEKADLPELPKAKLERYRKDLRLTEAEALELTRTPEISAFFEAAVKPLKFDQAKAVANLLIGLDFIGTRLTPEHLSDLVLTIEQGVVSSSGARTALLGVMKTGATIASTVESLGLKQVSDEGILDAQIDLLLGEFPAQVAELRAGKEKVLVFLIGQLMKKMGGKANPVLTQKIIRKKLK